MTLYTYTDTVPTKPTLYIAKIVDGLPLVTATSKTSEQHAINNLKRLCRKYNINFNF
jgi:hypothetical protein